ncbi:DnaD domain-containing protein [Bacillus massiliigorillae]|uniref:DnaD domain-containing protein n=1 Tax=Bacillus massiliigorillae TaxID=1243664 RepID=UPI0003A76FD3|nr:DnaD domain-containing protein [Bacillus massiliigorillae]
MIKDQLLLWLQEGSVTIPSFLFVHYVEMGLNEQELILLMHLQHFQKEGNDFPTPNEISERMSISSIECMNILRKLIQKGFLEINEQLSAESVHSETYSLVPLQKKMIEHFLLKQNKKTVINKEEEERSLYSIFEQEFGRPLSPFECETLGMWIDDDHHDSKVIQAALREAVISGKLNFRYIDRILFEWKKNGINTVEKAKVYGEKFRTQQHRTKQAQQPVKEVPFYNWLEN